MRCQYSNFWAQRLLSACILNLLLLPGAVTTSHAAFYKCVDSRGNTTYNDAPCDAHENTHLLSKSARELPVLDCRIAHNFAFDSVARMRQDDSADDVFDAYGGVNNLSDGAKNLINFVYSFQNKPLVPSQRIVHLTIERCRSGSLSKTLDKCEAFPHEFIKRFGGCISARQSEQTHLIQAPSIDPISRVMRDAASTSESPTLSAANPVLENEMDEEASDMDEEVFVDDIDEVSTDESVTSDPQTDAPDDDSQ